MGAYHCREVLNTNPAKPEELSECEKDSLQPPSQQNSHSVPKSSKKIRKHHQFHSQLDSDLQQISAKVTKCFQEVEPLFTELKTKYQSFPSTTNAVDIIVQCAQTQGIKAMRELTDEAVQQLRAQRQQLFKVNNNLEMEHQRARECLEKSACLTSTEIDEVLTHISNKLRDNQKNMEELSKMIEVGEKLSAECQPQNG